MPTATSKFLSFFFKIKYYIYSSIYIFCNHLTHVKMCYYFYLVSILFNVSLTKFFSTVPLIPFFSKPCDFYCAILHSVVIFRNTYATLQNSLYVAILTQSQAHSSRILSSALPAYLREFYRLQIINIYWFTVFKKTQNYLTKSFQGHIPGSSILTIHDIFDNS